MKKIGITGVIGSGKSTVIKLLKESGIMVLDCDQINHELLLKNKAGYNAMYELFGNDILNQDQEIDKQKLANQIFNNLEAKNKMEKILHPLIKNEVIKRMEKYRSEEIIVVEVPLLYETGFEDAFDEVWVVAADDDIRIKRLVLYRNINEVEANRRLKQQISQDEKIKRGDVVIYNNDDINALKKQVDGLLKANSINE